MIKTVIFDIGNVLAEFCWEQDYHNKGYEGELFERIANATTRNVLWNEYDRGVWTDDEIVSAFVETDPEIEKEIRESQKCLTGMIKREDYAIPWIRELKKNKYQVLYLSNFSQKAFDDCRAALDFMEYTDGGIMSYRVREIKPDNAIYQILIKQFELKPEECVFLDDRQENLDGAKANGIHTIRFYNYEQAYNELNDLLRASIV